MNEKLGAYLEENPKEAKAIFEKGMLAAEAREAARKARELTRRKNSARRQRACPASWPTAAARATRTPSCSWSKVTRPAAPPSRAATRNVQAILALRGKLLNVEKANLVKMLGHEEIRTIISALGCGIRDDFDLDKRRYGKIIIMTDADVDGSTSARCC